MCYLKCGSYREKCDCIHFWYGRTVSDSIGTQYKFKALSIIVWVKLMFVVYHIVIQLSVGRDVWFHNTGINKVSIYLSP